MREGDNLYANSILAIDANTGKYRWHFQEVHHDIWDYDAPNPVVLFDAPYNGKLLIGIDEKAVPQEPRQKTAKTQPYPVGDPIVPHQIDIVPEDAPRLPGSSEIANGGRNNMPTFREIYDVNQLRDVSEYIVRGLTAQPK